MRQGKDIIAEQLKRTALAAIAANNEIALTCPEHGPVKRSELLCWNASKCPKCYALALATAEQKQRFSLAVRHFEKRSGVPPRFMTASFESYRPQNKEAAAILARLQGYAENFAAHRAKGLSLILCGKTGTGKTHLACAILRALAHQQAVYGLYDTVYRAIQRVRETYGSAEHTEKEIVGQYVDADLLVLDEIGVQYGTDAERLILFSILNGRYEALRPSILVSNLTVKEIAEFLGDRIFDRMRENGGAVLAFTWASYRQGAK